MGWMWRVWEKGEIKEDSYVLGLWSGMEGAISGDEGDRRRNGFTEEIASNCSKSTLVDYSCILGGGTHYCHLSMSIYSLPGPLCLALP